jgi:hypothetical protein
MLLDICKQPHIPPLNSRRLRSPRASRTTCERGVLRKTRQTRCFRVLGDLAAETLFAQDVTGTRVSVSTLEKNRLSVRIACILFCRWLGLETCGGSVCIFCDVVECDVVLEMTRQEIKNARREGISAVHKASRNGRFDTVSSTKCRLSNHKY